MNKTKLNETKQAQLEWAQHRVEQARYFMRVEADSDGPYEMDLWYAMESLKRAVNELAQILEESETK